MPDEKDGKEKEGEGRDDDFLENLRKALKDQLENKPDEDYEYAKKVIKEHAKMDDVLFEMARRAVMGSVEREADRIIRKYPEPETREHLLSVLVEEVGEVARAVNDGKQDNYRDELVQVAAVAIASAIKELKRGDLKR